MNLFTSLRTLLAGLLLLATPPTRAAMPGEDSLQAVTLLSLYGKPVLVAEPTCKGIRIKGTSDGPGMLRLSIRITDSLQQSQIKYIRYVCSGKIAIPCKDLLFADGTEIEILGVEWAFREYGQDFLLRTTEENVLIYKDNRPCNYARPYVFTPLKKTALLTGNAREALVRNP